VLRVGTFYGVLLQQFSIESFSGVYATEEMKTEVTKSTVF
jgi:hypothetical protein